MRKLRSYPLRGFLRRMINCSARCIKKRENFSVKISSISSACLMQMLTRTELMDGSIKHLSFSLREMVTGCNRSSRLILRMKNCKGKMRTLVETQHHRTVETVWKKNKRYHSEPTGLQPQVCCAFQRSAKGSCGGTATLPTLLWCNPGRVSKYSPVIWFDGIEEIRT